MAGKKAQNSKAKGTGNKAKNPEQFSQIDAGGLAGQSPASYAQDYARQKRLNQLKKEEKRLSAELGAEAKIAKMATQKSGLIPRKIRRSLKKLDKAPTDRLSGNHAHRILILILIALFFDTLQLFAGIIELIPFVGLLGVLLEWFLLVLSFFVFIFFWRHYEVTFLERTIGIKKMGAEALKIMQLALITIMPIAEIIPIFPGITLKVIITIMLVRSIDKHRAKKEKLRQIQNEIDALQYGMSIRR